MHTGPCTMLMYLRKVYMCVITHWQSIVLLIEQTRWIPGASYYRSVEIYKYASAIACVRVLIMEIYRPLWGLCESEQGLQLSHSKDRQTILTSYLKTWCRFILHLNVLYVCHCVNPIRRKRAMPNHLISCRLLEISMIDYTHISGLLCHAWLSFHLQSWSVVKNAIRNTHAIPRATQPHLTFFSWSPYPKISAAAADASISVTYPNFLTPEWFSKANPPRLRKLITHLILEECLRQHSGSLVPAIDCSVSPWSQVSNSIPYQVPNSRNVEVLGDNAPEGSGSAAAATRSSSLLYAVLNTPAVSHIVQPAPVNASLYKPSQDTPLCNLDTVVWRGMRHEITAYQDLDTWVYLIVEAPRSVRGSAAMQTLHVLQYMHVFKVLCPSILWAATYVNMSNYNIVGCWTKNICMWSQADQCYPCSTMGSVYVKFNQHACLSNSLQSKQSTIWGFCHHLPWSKHILRLAVHACVCYVTWCEGGPAFVTNVAWVRCTTMPPLYDACIIAQLQWHTVSMQLCLDC